jgi:hypothetical protein
MSGLRLQLRAQTISHAVTFALFVLLTAIKRSDPIPNLILLVQYGTKASSHPDLVGQQIRLLARNVHATGSDHR